MHILALTSFCAYIYVTLFTYEYTNTMPEQHTKAQNLRKRLKVMGITHGITNKSMSEAIGYHPVYVSAVLRGKYESEAVLAMVEEYLDKVESGEIDTEEEDFPLAQAA